MHVPWKIDSYFSGILLVAAANALAIGGLMISRRILRRHDLISTHEVGGFLLSVVGTMYAVILGLIVVDSMTKFQQAQQMTEQEANGLANIVLLANHFPAETGRRVHAEALAYANLVIDREWDLLDEGRHSPEAQASALRLIATVTEFDPKTEREQSSYEVALSAVGDFWNARRYRVVTAAYGLPGLEWFVLISGGVITVMFTYFFKLEHLRIQVVMTSLVATIIALNLYMVLGFGYPFAGSVKVRCDSFNVAELCIEHGGNPGPPDVGRGEHAGSHHPMP